MAICKLCDPMKIFKIISPTHLKHAHGTTIAEYPALVEHLEVPKEILEENAKLEAEIRANKLAKATTAHTAVRGNIEEKDKPNRPMTAAEVWLLEQQSRKNP